MSFDSHLWLEFHGPQVIFDAGFLGCRERDKALGLTTLAEDLLGDWRTGQNTQHSMTAVLRQSLYCRLAGYEDSDDAERLTVDPAMRQVVGGRASQQTAASTSKNILLST